VWPDLDGSLEAFGTYTLHRALDKRGDLYCFSLRSLTFIGTLMIRDLLPVITIDAPQRDRWADYIFGQIGCRALVV